MTMTLAMGMAMAAASLKQPYRFLYSFVLAIFLLHRPVYSDSDGNNGEVTLLQGLNSYRTSEKLPAFTLSPNAHCVAKEIADYMGDDDNHHPCANPSSAEGVNKTGLSEFPKVLYKCNIDANSARDVVVLPVCVPHLVPTLVLSSFTQTYYSGFLKDSSLTGIGLKSEEDWMVVVLTKNGSLTNGASSLVNGKFGLSYYMVFLLSGFVLTCL